MWAFGPALLVSSATIAIFNMALATENHVSDKTLITSIICFALTAHICKKEGDIHQASLKKYETEVQNYVLDLDNRWGTPSIETPLGEHSCENLSRDYRSRP